MIRPDLRALWALTEILIRRLFREGLVIRSMLWPPALAAGTLMATLAVVILLRASATVAVPPNIDTELRRSLVQAEYDVIEVADPSKSVLTGQAWAGTDGASIWMLRTEVGSVGLEEIVRKHRGSDWRPVNRAQRPGTETAAVSGAIFVQLLTLLFALYGVVFGVGMVARDRDDGTLEAELSLPISRWVPGAARWIAGTVMLTLFLGYSIAIFDALIGVPDPVALLRHGFAACGGAMTLGIAVIGTAGAKRGFSGPLAFALTGAAALFGLGVGAPGVSAALPLASVFAGGSGWTPLLLALCSGVGSALVFAWRSAKA